LSFGKNSKVFKRIKGFVGVAKMEGAVNGKKIILIK
jgi:hypothetical protein